MPTTHQATSARIITAQNTQPNQIQDTALEKLSAAPIPPDALLNGSRDITTEDGIVVLTEQTPVCHEMEGVARVTVQNPALPGCFRPAPQVKP
jgi:hypothetical protein